MHPQYIKGGLILICCIIAFMVASRSQFYNRKSEAATYSKYLGSGCSGCLWITVKILAIMMALYGLAMILQDYQKTHMP